MSLLIISHTYVTPMNQKKVNALVPYFKNVHLLAPKFVRDTLRNIEFNLMPGAQFKAHTARSYLDFHNSFRIYNPSDLEKCFQEAQPTTVLVEQEPYSLSTYQITKLKKKYKFKYFLFTFQNIYKEYPFPFSMIEQKNLQSCDHLIIGNDSGIEVWRKKGVPENKISVLPQVGVDLDEFFPMNKSDTKKKFGLDGFVAGYAGRFVEEKGIDVLLKAAVGIPNLTIALVGKGPKKEELQNLSQKLDVKIKFIEGITHEKMPEVLNAFDVLVLPSLQRKHWREQFGHVLIEALACGIPCIGTDIDPINKVIGNCGLVFPENSEIELRNCLTRLIREYSAYTSDKMVARVRENFTNQIIGQKLLQLDQIVKGQP